MNKANVANIMRSAKLWTVKHSPEILTGLGIAGMLTTTVLAVRATPKALMLIEDAEFEKKEPLTVMEKVKVAWKPYIPAAITGVVSTACLIGASSVHVKRNAALATAYKLSETALMEYRDAVVETVGEKKEQAIQEKVNQNQLEKYPVNQTNIYNTGKGNTLFLEPLSTRYFRSDIELVRRAENALNKEMLHGMYGYVSLNDFYDELGLEHTDASTGDTMGWNTEHLIDLNITPGMTQEEEPCLVIGHYNRPIHLP